MPQQCLDNPFLSVYSSSTGSRNKSRFLELDATRATQRGASSADATISTSPALRECHDTPPMVESQTLVADDVALPAAINKSDFF